MKTKIVCTEIYERNQRTSHVPVKIISRVILSCTFFNKLTQFIKFRAFLSTSVKKLESYLEEFLTPRYNSMNSLTASAKHVENSKVERGSFNNRL